MCLEVIRHGLDQRAREEHPGLRGIDADVVEHRVELLADEGGWQLLDGRDSDRVLRRQRDEHGRAVAAGGRERLQVGLDAGAAARVRGGDRQTTRYQASPFAGANRIRFDGWDLSPPGHPGYPRLATPF